MNALAALQQDFQDYLLGNSDKVAGAIQSNDRRAIPDQLAVYRFAYRQRLTEALANDFPGLQALLGVDAFAALARSYVTAHPSRHPSLRALGAALPDFLAGMAAPPLHAAMARFDWAVTQAFDAADEAPLAMADILSLPPAAWESFRLAFAASLGVVAGDQILGDLRRALLRDAPHRDLVQGQPADWLIWRQEDQVQYRQISAAEKAALTLMRAGGTFGAMCGLLAEREAAPQRAAEFLKDWVDRGLVVGLVPGTEIGG